MKLALAAGRVGELRVPQRPEYAIEALRGLVGQLIAVQMMATYPGSQFPLPL